MTASGFDDPNLLIGEVMHRARRVMATSLLATGFATEEANRLASFIQLGARTQCFVAAPILSVDGTRSEAADFESLLSAPSLIRTRPQTQPTPAAEDREHALWVLSELPVLTATI